MVKKGILWVLHGLVFCGFLFVVFLAIQKAEEEEWKTFQEQNREELVQILSNVGKQSRPVSRYQDLVERLVRALQWGEPPKKPLEPFQNPGLEIFLFDSHGERVLQEGFARHKIGVSEKFLNVLKAVAVNPSFRMVPREMTFASAFAGNSAAIPMLAVRPGQMNDLRTIGIQKLAGWFPLELNGKKVGDLLAWISPDGITPEDMAAAAVEKIQKKVPGEMRFGWMSLLEPEKSGDGSGKKLSARFREKLARNHFQTVFSSGSHWFAIFDLESHIRLFGYRPFSSPFYWYILLKSAIFCCGIGGILVTAWLTIWGSSLSLRVSAKLGALFSLMGFTGIFILLFMAHAYRQSEEKALIRENRKTSLDILRKVDGNFLAAFRPDLEFYKKLIGEVEKRPERYPETLLKLKERMIKGPIHSAYYVNETGKMVFRIPLQSWDSAGMAAGVQENFANGNCLGILNRFNKKTSAISGGLREISVIAKDTAGLDLLFKNLGNFLSFSAFDESVTFFQSPILASDGHALGVIWIGHDTRNMEAFHTQRMAKLIQKGSRYRLMGIPRTADVRLRIIPHPGILNQDLIRQMQEELNQTGMTSQRLGVFNRQKVLVCAIPGMNLHDYNLFLLSSFKPIAQEAQRIVTIFYAAAFFLFLITLQVIFLISEVLLVPIKEISLGIEFLKEMEFGHRIKIQTGDEMEHISKGINEALEGMDELALSLTIQEHLFPAASLVTSEVCLHGWKKTVSPTGSLFFDSMMLADHRVAFFIRKTAGTGVDSALTLSMDRTTMRLLLEDPGIRPAKVIREWKEFQEQAEEKGDETPFIMGILDLSSGMLVGDGMGSWKGILVEGVEPRDLRGTGLLTWELGKGNGNGSPGGFSLHLERGRGLLLLCAETWHQTGLVAKEAPSPEFWERIQASLRNESMDVGTALFGNSPKDQVIIFLHRLAGGEG